MARGGAKFLHFIETTSSVSQSVGLERFWSGLVSSGRKIEVRNKGILIKIPMCQKFYLFPCQAKCINQTFAQPAINSSFFSAALCLVWFGW